MRGARGGKCNCCVSSKIWDTLHDDPAAYGQRWYCPRPGCGARYLPKRGVVCEIIDKRPARRGLPW
eukprot:7827556-Alexandrium_andersonii.AAC.1